MEQNQTKAFMIHCTTGCSCCREDNHYCGPFSDRDIAKYWAKEFHDKKKLASQYAPNGCYDISEHDAEILPDGRLIIGNTVFPGWADENGWNDMPYTGFGPG